VFKVLARIFLKLTGWAMAGEVPTARSYVLIAAPHTSNWDLAYMLAIAWLCDVNIHWMGKHTLFSPPFGWVMKRLGGIPIYRHRRDNIVQQMAEQLTSRGSLVLVVPPEGTRGPAEYWKSGFYHIANLAQVPIVMGYLDYAKKRGGFGPALMPTGDVKTDMKVIRAFYNDKVGKHLDNHGRIRLREEGEDARRSSQPRSTFRTREIRTPL
jgi:1-acyl-sn-glycerol-3-phosphate acyltransferase